MADLRYSSAMNRNIERLLPILVHIQAHLAEELSLATLAALANLSPYHFHRLFRTTVGETVKHYIQRLRLEQAAFQLKLHDTPIIDVAFSLGYHSHETFTRAFRKHFAVPPNAYRRHHRQPAQRIASQLPALNQAATQPALSKVRMQRLEAITVAFIRHWGAYTDADAGAFDTLIEWAIATGRYTGENLLMGIGHDDPQITPTAKVRFDACLQVDAPFTPTGVIGCQTVPAGDYVALTYVGPYGAAMAPAYGALFAYMQRRSDYTLLGLPAVEIYRTTRINPDYALNHTEILLPLVKKGI